MKNKLWVIMSMWSLLPIFLASMLFGITGFVYWLGNADEQLGFKRLIDGHMNNSAIAIISLLSIIGLTIIFTTLTCIFLRNIDKIDELDKATEAYYNAEKQMKSARDKYTQKLTELN